MNDIRKTLIWIASHINGIEEGEGGKTKDNLGNWEVGTGLRSPEAPLHGKNKNERQKILNTLLENKTIEFKNDKYYVTTIGKEMIQKIIKAENIAGILFLRTTTQNRKFTNIKESLISYEEYYNILNKSNIEIIFDHNDNGYNKYITEQQEELEKIINEKHEQLKQVFEITTKQGISFEYDFQKKEMIRAALTGISRNTKEIEYIFNELVKRAI